MRTISSTLKAAQEATSGTPYIRLLFISADGYTTHDYSSRKRQIEHHEEAYNDYAVIILRDDDRAVADLRGYWVEIGYGFVASGNEYSSTARLWVKSQQHISLEGVLHVILELEGMWAVLREHLIALGDPPFYNDREEWWGSHTIFDIIDAVLEEVGFGLSAPITQDDAIITSYKPLLEVNAQPFESAAGIIRRLIEMTKSYLRSKTNRIMDVIYPQTADAAGETYYSDQAHFFFEYMERKNTLIPNHVIVFANAGDDEQWTNVITAEVEDTAEIARYGFEIVWYYIAADITNQTDANNRAAALLTRAKAEMLGGRLLIPHDSRVELYDRVSVEDAR